MTKKFDFAREITQVLRALGAREGRSYAWQLDTRAGQLDIHPFEDWVACRFDDVERARREVSHGQLNCYSGKWNWHFVQPNANDVEYFRRQLEVILTQRNVP